MMNSFKNNFAKILSVDLETFNYLCSMIYNNNLTPSISSFERVNLQFCVKKCSSKGIFLWRMSIHYKGKKLSSNMNWNMKKQKKNFHNPKVWWILKYFIKVILSSISLLFLEIRENINWFFKKMQKLLPTNRFPRDLKIMLI